MTKLEKAYVAMQNASGLKVGDKVKVLRKAADYEMGWRNSWVFKSMTEAVGGIYTVHHIADDGIRFKERGSRFPFFVLEKVEDAKPKPWKHGDYGLYSYSQHNKRDFILASNNIKGCINTAGPCDGVVPNDSEKTIKLGNIFDELNAVYVNPQNTHEIVDDCGDTLTLEVIGQDISLRTENAGEGYWSFTLEQAKDFALKLRQVIAILELPEVK